MTTHRFDPRGTSAAMAARQRHLQPHRALKLARLAFAAAVAGSVSMAAWATGTATGSSTASTQSTVANKSTSGMKAYRGLRASEVIGMSVRNPQGNNIGQISDMIVNMNTGKVHYAVLTFDPGIFQGEKLYSVPTTELRMAPDRNDVIYNMSRERLERASVDRADWDRRWQEPGFFNNLDKLWSSPQAMGNARAYRASDLIGKDIKSRSGENIGELEELVVDMANQRVHYAVMQFDPSWTTPGQNYAFPLRAFNLGANRDDLVLDIDKSRLQAMKSFSDDRYQQLSDPVWVVDVDRYLVTVYPAATANTRDGGTSAARGTRAGGTSDGRTQTSTSAAGTTRDSTTSTAGRTPGADSSMQAWAARTDRN